MAWLGWVGNALLLAGALGIGDRHPAGFLLIAAGETLWSLKSFKMRQWDMLAICLAFAGLAVRNFLLWTRP